MLAGRIAGGALALGRSGLTNRGPNTVKGSSLEPAASGNVSPRAAISRWQLVLDSSTQRSKALEQLCRTYANPVYAYVRGTGWPPADAFALAHGFFQQLLRQRELEAESDRERFRCWLMTALRAFLGDPGRAPPLAGGTGCLFDGTEAERHYRALAAPQLDPERVYSRSWALAVLERALAGLEHEFSSRGEHERYAQLRPWLVARPGAGATRALERRLALGTPSLRITLARARLRLQSLVRLEVGDSIERRDPRVVCEEIDWLLAALEV